MSNIVFFFLSNIVKETIITTPTLNVDFFFPFREYCELHDNNGDEVSWVHVTTVLSLRLSFMYTYRFVLLIKERTFV